MAFDQTPSTTPKPKSNLWLIATIVLAVVLVVGSIVFAWQKSASNKVKSDLQSQINTLRNQVQQLTKIIPADETADWKTYTNEQFNFEMKYPKEWSFVEYPTINAVGFGNQDNPPCPEGVGECSSPMDIQISMTNIQEAIKSVGRQLSDTTTENVIINNQNGIQIEGYYQGLTGGPGERYEGLKTIRIFFSHNNKTYEITIEERQKNDIPNLDILNQMLNTFKFTK
ncbi:MAG: hypothetical protein COY09_00825 [Candidatus Portnoybacteria bacterium CG_4_10_14_0_2_um_filter_39_11]|uniref:PsbP C-terminal domain-containing protein n=1 Tax=Candidatus Portnoybacteria bacterium CG_4_10_14_0_2_um_filter_39_11 TaxID=1974797 RepID=A0A2M7UJH1_9BACT|nr:MAG: hypothetical protein COY09_00825 [Candidatus Portnoybacteria bacterium CG_4_10_14_0_2_um_filter_39_11]